MGKKVRRRRGSRGKSSWSFRERNEKKNGRKRKRGNGPMVMALERTYPGGAALEAITRNGREKGKRKGCPTTEFRQGVSHHTGTKRRTGGGTEERRK